MKTRPEDQTLRNGCNVRNSGGASKTRSVGRDYLATNQLEFNSKVCEIIRDIHSHIRSCEPRTRHTF